MYVNYIIIYTIECNFKPKRNIFYKTICIKVQNNYHYTKFNREQRMVENTNAFIIVPMMEIDDQIALG